MYFVVNLVRNTVTDFQGAEWFQVIGRWIRERGYDFGNRAWSMFGVGPSKLQFGIPKRPEVSAIRARASFRIETCVHVRT